MKIILSTQCRENYGAHDWSGEGACPQHWKNKFGSFYLVENVSIEEAQNADFWNSIHRAVECFDNYQEIQVVEEWLVDEDADLSQYKDHWETFHPIVKDANGEMRELSPVEIKMLNEQAAQFACLFDQTYFQVFTLCPPATSE